MTGGQISSTPLVVDGMLFVGSNDSNMYAMWADDGGSLWQFHTGGAVESSPMGLLTSY